MADSPPQEGDTAPRFRVPMADGDVGEFDLEDTDGTVVLAFFPGAFTPVCTDEMCEMRDSLSEFDDLGAEVYGVSVDTPFALNAFRDENDLNFPLLSDFDKEVIDEYGVRMEELAGLHGLAKRSVFVIDDREVVYRWVSDDPSVLPDFDEIKDAVEEAG
ncbi:MAG: redoxin domain-containing protein [Halobacteria archaeon]|nr:redoxin domain-containing protein [Halobacteria archaeon]